VRYRTQRRQQQAGPRLVRRRTDTAAPALLASRDSQRAHRHNHKVPVSIVVFILLGLSAGYVALGLFKSTGKGVLLDFGLGVIGAVIAGSIFNHFAARTAVEVNAASALVAALTGAVVLLASCHTMLGDTRHRPHDPT
jgi:uncharacterized membrane protein YeaQ/YmgE (transglycosylase-associated protein family)